MATRDALSPLLADVTNAVNQSAVGDTVRIPAGSATWPSPLTLSKAIILQGAGNGTGGTRITRGAGSVINIALPLVQAGNNVRVTGIYFDLVNWVNSASYGVVIPANSKCTSLRIDSCTFNRGSRAIYPRGWVNGVIDHCTFINNDIAVSPEQLYDPETQDGDNSWARGVVPGTSDSVFIEDNTFIVDTVLHPDLNETLYGANGARAVFRHNVLTSTYTGDTVVIDAHGPYPPNGARSTCLYEVYENTIHVKRTYRFCNLRGGRHLFWNNEFIMDDTGSPVVIGLLHELSGNPQISTDQIKDSYFYNNTFNGSPVNPVSVDGLEILNADYFNHQPLTGQAFFPYIPYQYPHPLVVMGPSIIVSPSSLDFGPVLVGDSTALFPSVSNQGQGTLTGAATTSSPFSVASGSPYNVVNGTSVDVGVSFIPIKAGGSTQAVTFSGGGGASIPVTGIGVEVLPSLMFAADDGTVIAPFVVDGSNHVSQPSTTSLIAGGLSAYGFTIVDAGDYKLVINVKTETTDANSFFVAIDSIPTDPEDIWDVNPITTGYADRIVGTRGNGSGPNGQQFPVKTWTLSAGDHLLVVRGREGGSHLGQITVTPVTIATLPDAPTYISPLNGETDVVITAPLTWNPAANATSYDVFFGTTNPPPQVQSAIPETTWSTKMSYSTPYFWQVRARNANGITPGPIYSFTTLEETTAVSSPSPANGATGVSVTPVLAWTGKGETYDIAFDSFSPPTTMYNGLTDNQFDVEDEAGTLSNSTTYYWSVLLHPATGPDVQGPEWSFTTAAAQVIVPKILFVS